MTNHHQKQRFLAEWQPQEAVLMAWPYPNSDWQPWLADISQNYVELTRAISLAATPLILCQNPDHHDQIIAQLGPELARKAVMRICPYDDTWCRDFGPITLGNGNQAQALIDFQFTGWGHKHQADADNLVNSQLQQANLWQLPLTTIKFDLEGGAIETDGQGTLLTTQACLMAGNRNQQLAQEQVEQALIDYLGVDRVLWLTHGCLLGDDTDSHVDNLVRFADPQTLVYLSCDNPQDPHYQPLKAMEQQVLALKQSNGQSYRCFPVLLPDPVHDETGNRLPASYVNFLILNDIVIVPVFGKAQDNPALQTLSKAFPRHQLVTIDGRHLIKQFGGPHCATMQLPVNCLQPHVLPRDSR